MDDNQLRERFEAFKRITNEESIIASIIKKNLRVDKRHKVLDIGSNVGKISHAIQGNHENITLIDVDEFDIHSKARFIKNTWEEVQLDQTFDVILASHIWGHFEYTKTAPFAFKKMLHVLRKEGKLVICHNTNEDFLQKLIRYSREIFSSFQYDSFDDSLLNGLHTQEIFFSVPLQADTFQELSQLVQVLIIVPDKEFEKKEKEIETFLRKYLEYPEFTIRQRILILSQT